MGTAIDTDSMTIDELAEAIDFAPTYTEQVAYIDAFFARWGAANKTEQTA